MTGSQIFPQRLRALLMLTLLVPGCAVLRHRGVEPPSGKTQSEIVTDQRECDALAAEAKRQLDMSDTAPRSAGWGFLETSIHTAVWGPSWEALVAWGGVMLIEFSIRGGMAAWKAMNPGGQAEVHRDCMTQRGYVARATRR